MKIALISYGFGEYCITQANELAKQSELLLLMPENDVGQCEMSLHPSVQCCAFKNPRLRQAIGQVNCVRKLVQCIKRFDPDVVHLQSGHLWFNLALPLLRGYPFVVTIHDAQHHPGDLLSRKTPQAVLNLGYRSADQVIVHSEYVRQRVLEYQRIPAEKVAVIPHVAIGQRRDISLTSIAAGLWRPNVLFFGRIFEYKGLEYLIRAQPEISRHVPEARFVIGGEGDEFARYRRLMADPDRFVVHNEWVSDGLRTRMFQEAAVVVLPYVEASQSGVIPVAYSFGKPVIATRVGGLPEMVEDGQTGLLVPRRDVAALATAISSLLSDPLRCQAMGRAGHQELQSKSSPAVVAERMLSVYRQTIEKCRGGQRRGTDRVPTPADETVKEPTS